MADETVEIPLGVNTDGAVEGIGKVGDAVEDTAKKSESAFAKLNKTIGDKATSIGTSLGAAAKGIAGMGAALVGATASAVIFSAQIEGKAKRSLTALTKEADNLTFALQTLLSESGASSALIDPLTAALADLNAWVVENNVEIQSLALDGVGGLGDAMVTLTPIVETLTATLTAIVGGLDMLVSALAITTTGVTALTLKLGSLTTGALADAAHGFASLTSSARELATWLGADGVAGSLGELEGAYKGAATTLEKYAGDLERDATTWLKVTDTLISDLEVKVEKWEKRIGDTGRLVGEWWSKIGQGIKDGADKGKAALEDQGNVLKRGRPGARTWLAQQEAILELERQILAATRAQDEPLVLQLETQKRLAEIDLARLQARTAAKSARERELIDQRAQLEVAQALYDAEQQRATLARTQGGEAATTRALQLQLQLLAARDPLQRAALERQLAEAHAAAQLAASEGKINDHRAARIAIAQAYQSERDAQRDLATQQRALDLQLEQINGRVELARLTGIARDQRAVELQLQQEIGAAHATYLASQQTLTDQLILQQSITASQLAAEQQRAQLSEDALNRQLDQLSQLADAWTSAFSAGSGAAAGALGELSAGLSQAIAQYQVLKEAGLDASSSLNGAAVGMVGAIGGAYAQSIEDTKKAAKVQAAFAVAQAVLFGALGNYPAAAAAAASAVKFGIVAGTADNAGPATGTASAGTAMTQSVAAGVSTVDADRAGRQNAALIAEALGAREVGGITINLNMQNATLLEDSVVTSRRITDTVLDGMERRGLAVMR